MEISAPEIDSLRRRCDRDRDREPDMCALLLASIIIVARDSRFTGPRVPSHVNFTAAVARRPAALPDTEEDARGAG